MEIRVLRYFLAVAREGNITEAANALHITQPTLSRQLMDLEYETGKKLLNRGKRKVSLTDDGLLLKKYAEDIVALVEKAETDLRATDDRITGELVIGGAEAARLDSVARTIGRLHVDYPDITFNTYSRNAVETMKLLDQGLLDLGIVIHVTNLQKYDYISLPSVERWGVIMRKDSPLAKKEAVSPSDLIIRPLILSYQIEDRSDLRGWFGMPTEELNVVARFDLIFYAKLMVRAGLGYAITIDNMLSGDDKDGDLCFKPLDPPLSMRMNIIWRKYAVLSKATKKFLQYVREDGGNTDHAF